MLLLLEPFEYISEIGGRVGPSSFQYLLLVILRDVTPCLFQVDELPGMEIERNHTYWGTLLLLLE